MDGMRFKPDSCSLVPRKKRTTRLYRRVDRISELHDDIIIHILSSLSLKEAATTSLLSSRWSDLWKKTPSILLFYRSFNLWNVGKCKNIGFVDSFLKLHKNPRLKQFTVSFYVNKSSHLNVTKWLEFSFLRGVERLELDFWCQVREDKVVLDEVLRLSSPRTLILFRSLRRLCLRHFRVSGEAINIFLCNCPLMEELIITLSNLTSDVEVCGETLVLKHLEIGFCSGGKSVYVSAPNLTCLKASDDTPVKVLPENVPKVVEGSFSFIRKGRDIARDFASAVFCFSSQLRILDLYLNFPKVFLSMGFPEMPNLRKLVVEYVGVKTESLLPVTALLWASPRLKMFKLVFRERRGHEAVQVIRSTVRSPHRHLELFEFAGFIGGAGDHIELVTYISDNCIALRKITVGRKPITRIPYEAPGLIDEEQAARDYAEEHLQGRLPMHTQLRLL